jgi:crossover junction endodeoxyribonuclease RuvC
MATKVTTTDREKIIMGIDPGTLIMGYGVIRCVGSKIELLALGSIHFNSKDDHQLRLKKIYERVTSMIEEFLPDYMAIESQFFGKNVQSMLKLGRAQGVSMAAGLNKNIPVIEYSPKKVKQSITGNGNATKDQVAAMLQRLCNFTETPQYLDATDALGIAVCHHFQQSSGIETGRGKANSWNAFINQNPDRVKKNTKLK